VKEGDVIKVRVEAVEKDKLRLSMMENFDVRRPAAARIDARG